jgi:hypothetical protein
MRASTEKHTGLHANQFAAIRSIPLGTALSKTTIAVRAQNFFHGLVDALKTPTAHDSTRPRTRCKSQRAHRQQFSES